jgi:hypothetical protein
VPKLVSQSSQDVYTRLEASDLRLLSLRKGAFDDPIHGMLDVSSLDNPADFIALSYAWADETGDDSRHKTIFLGPFWDIFNVTANCFAALRRMRQTERDVKVWVDAICIDQGNHVERNHQVGLMARIYSLAREVFVYIGEGNQELEATARSLQWKEDAKAIDPRLVRELFRCRYFSRIWVIQEVANAKTATLHYGSKSIKWTSLYQRRLSSLFSRKAWSSIPQWVTTIYSQPQYTASDLPRLLLDTADCQAADLRDRIFALFGLLQNASNDGLVPDYSLAVPEVLTGIAAFIILNLGLRWDPKSAIGQNSRRLPTWVPDWTRAQYWWSQAQTAQPRDHTYPPHDLRISNSGCLTVRAATLLHSDDFALYWTRTSAASSRRAFSVAGVHTVPPGRIVVFPGSRNLFYLADFPASVAGGSPQQPPDHHLHPFFMASSGPTPPLRYHMLGTFRNEILPSVSFRGLVELRIFRRIILPAVFETDLLPNWLRDMLVLDRRVAEHFGRPRPANALDLGKWLDDEQEYLGSRPLQYRIGQVWNPEVPFWRYLAMQAASRESSPLWKQLDMWGTEEFWGEVAVLSQFTASQGLGLVNVEYLKTVFSMYAFLRVCLSLRKGWEQWEEVTLC